MHALTHLTDRKLAPLNQYLHHNNGQGSRKKGGTPVDTSLTAPTDLENSLDYAIISIYTSTSRYNRVNHYQIVLFRSGYCPHHSFFLDRPTPFHESQISPVPSFSSTRYV